MGKLRCHISISADGFVAGPNQSEENPLGEGGEWLHDWGVSLAAWRELHGKQGGEVNESTRVMEETAENIGAGVMGRNMFGPPGGGDWGDEEWKGWRGGRPAVPQRRLHPHPSPARSGRDGGRDHVPLRHRRDRARAGAGERVRGRQGRPALGRRPGDPAVSGGGQLDGLELHIVPVLLGDGARLFDDLGDAEPRLERRSTSSSCLVSSRTWTYTA